MARRLFFFIAICMFPLSSYGDKYAKLEKRGETISIPYELSLNEVEAAIIDGSIKRGWEPKKLEDGVIEDTLHIRSHVAVVHVVYDAKSFRIDYADSTNLLDTESRKDRYAPPVAQYTMENTINSLRNTPEGIPVIHKNYYLWVDNLKNYILNALAEAKHSSEKRQVGVEKDSISNKLRELETLRKEGLITDSEYKTKRQKLLDQF